MTKNKTTSRSGETGRGAGISRGRREGVGKDHKVKKELSNVSVVCHDGAETRIDSMPNTGKARCSIRAQNTHPG